MSAEAELEHVLRQLTDSIRPSREQMRTFLRLAREVKQRDPEPVARYGLQLLQSSSGLAEEEYCVLHEQAAIALLECCCHQKAAPLIKALLHKFPDSMRAKRLQGMYFEATGREQQAEEIYKDGLREEPSNDMLLKRLVALEKTRGNTTGAIDALRKYLDAYQNDRDAWEELAELYSEACLYKQAAFCYEELLLQVPNSATYTLRYASALYSAGGPNCYKLARSYFAKAVTLSAGLSLRALYGICACTAQLEKDARSLNQELAPSAVEALLQQYGEAAPEKLPLVKGMLQRQGLLQAQR